MATFEVKIEEIKVHPHPNADRLELAQVGLYNIVVAKGLWKTGDKGFYIPEFSVLPQELIIFMGLEGKLSGSNHDRVKPIMLRNALSQGLIAPLTLVSEEILAERGEDADYADVLNITKWEPIIPANMGGDVIRNTDIVPWIEIENLKKFPDLFNEGEEVVLTEKIHGTCSCYTFINPEEANELIVTSKGLGKSGLALKEDEKNLYWRMAHKYNLSALAKATAEKVQGKVEKVAIFGETYGNVQDLKYGHNGTYGFAMFDIHVTYVDEEQGRKGVWLNPETVEELAQNTGIPTPPVLYSGPFTLEIVEKTASGKEQVSGTEAHIREGVVIRPKVRKLTPTGSPKIAKFVSAEYLTRKGGTEFN